MPVTAGWWLAYVSVIYVVVGTLNFAFDFCDIIILQLLYLLCLSLPLFITPMARKLRIKTIWEMR